MLKEYGNSQCLRLNRPLDYGQSLGPQIAFYFQVFARCVLLARMPKAYSKVNIEISNICNLQCTFCPEVIRPKSLMDVKLFESVIRQVAPLTKLVTFHLMGEPLVHPQFSQLVQICKEYGVQIFLVTNGVLLKESHYETLLNPTFKQINFSLHSFQDNFGEKDPSEYLNRIFEFTELAFAKAPELYLNYRLWNLNSPLGKKVTNHSILKRVENRFQFQMNQKVDVRVKKSVPIKNRLYLHFDSEFIWPQRDLPVLGTSGTCYGLSSHFGILVDGTVVPCCLDKEGDISLGNLQQIELTEILKSPRAQNMLSGFRNQKLVESLCQRCQYIERFA